MKRFFYKMIASYAVVIGLMTAVALYYCGEGISIDKILVIAAVAILALLLSFYFVSDITMPIAKIVAVTKKVARGDFSQRIEISHKDDTRMLLENMNYMIEHLQFLFDRLKEEKEDKENLIHSMHDGFIIIDESGVIITSNKAFNSICGENDVDGRFFWEILRDEQLNDFFREIRKTYVDDGTEINLNGKCYLCSFSYVKLKHQFIIILYDISERKRLETVKKDFIVNVSHELRTPLTAIKGFVETLADESSGENLHYLGIINRHTDRLINIVNDLLTLSELEDESIELIVDEIRLQGFFNNILMLFKASAAAKKLSLTAEVNPAELTIMGDTFKLEQVFINLVDNAIKYTDAGGVSLKAEDDGENVRIEVSDTGIGIPENQLDRIFERFYVVDKSRSRKVGGTGLGLSIVKHIVILHGGTISIKSSPKAGSKFILSLPKGKI